MAVPTVYRWDDANAPVMTDIHDWTQIKAWYQAIFVNGYLEDDNVTAKPALGWGISSDDTTKKITIDMVGDPITENLMRIVLDYVVPTTSQTSYYGAKCVVYEHQDNNILVTEAHNSNILFGLNDDNLKIIPWIVIGTPRGFYTLAGYNKLVAYPNIPTLFSDLTNAYAFNYFGNYINDGVNLGKNIQCCMGVDRGTISNISLYASNSDNCYQGNAQGQIKISRNYLNILTTSKYLSHKESMDHIYNAYIGVYTKGLKYPYLDGGLYIKPMALWDKDDGVYYGKMPAMYYPEHTRPLTTSNHLIEFDGSGVYAGHKFIGIGALNANEFYINITEDWGI